jgi:hypothetical protein
MKAAVLSLAALLLAGCGARDDSLFPLQAGHRWRYRMATTLDDAGALPQVEEVEIRTRETALVAGAPAFRRTSSDGISYFLRRDASGIYRVASQGPLEPAPRLDAAPRFVLKAPYAPGTQWQADTTPYLLQRRFLVPHELRKLPRYRELPMAYRIAATGESLETAAGRFSGCLRVEGTGTLRLVSDDSLAGRDFSLSTREWYCPRVGLVKLVRSEPSPTQVVVGGTVTMELLSYE